jgi:flavodoxin
MKAMVVYDSQFGNSAEVVQAIGKALGEVLGSQDQVDMRQASGWLPLTPG